MKKVQKRILTVIVSLTITGSGIATYLRYSVEHGVLAALQPVGAEDDAGPLADPVRPLQTGDTVVVIGFLLGHICLLPG